MSHENLPKSWSSLDAHFPSLEKEAIKEISPEHPLHGIPLKAVARNLAADDVLFQLPDGRLTEIHLTWIGQKDCPPWPTHRIYDDWDAWLAYARRWEPFED